MRQLVAISSIAMCGIACSTKQVVMCPAGQVLVADHCYQVCTTDADCQDTSFVCEEQVCQVCPGCHASPTLTGIDGNGSVDGTAGHAAHFVRNSLFVTGTNLARAELWLSAEELRATRLALRGMASANRLEAILPADVVAGRYTLTAVNEAGSYSTSLVLLQGQKGDPGNYTIGDGLILDGTKLSVEWGGSGEASTVARSDHAHAGLTCTEEFDYLEKATGVVEFWPGPAKRAELFAYGWLCWNRTGDGLKISPLTDGVLLNQYWHVWQGGSYKVCGRITYIPPPQANLPAFLVYAQVSYYYGLWPLDGTSNAWHGHWAAGGADGSGGVTGEGDRWTIYTCR